MARLARLGGWARAGFGRIVPEPFVVAVGLTVAVGVAAWLRGTAPGVLLAAWSGAGLWKLLAFAMQMCLMLVLGSALAAAPVVRRSLAWMVAWARTPGQLAALVAFGAVALALLNWSLGLVGGALLAREAGRRARERGWRVDYPLLCAAGYAGLMAWHGGFSGSAPLKAASLSDQVELLGPELGRAVGAVALSETLLGSLNLWVSGGLLLLAPLLFAGMVPRDDPAARAAPERVMGAAETEARAGRRAAQTLLERVERARFWVWALALPAGAAVWDRLASPGGRLDFNTVNLALWSLALVAHGRPDRFLAACEAGARACVGVIVQFPLYAGIMGIMTASGLSAALASGAEAAGPDGLPVAVFLSAGVLNLLVPSGGGQWAVQGPILTQAALDLGVPVPTAIMAMAYGDQWTNMLQPFWALPLLALTGIRARDMVGYSVLWMAAGGLWILACLLVVP